MIRVLHVLGGLGTGGTECLIMNWYRYIDRTKVQFDFLVRSQDDNFVDEIHELGGNIYYTADFPRHILKNHRETEAIIKTKQWNVIHVHGNAAIYMSALILAKKYKVPCRIMHSHSIQAQKSAYTYLHYCNRSFLNKYANVRLACSSKAGEWMFNKGSFQVLHNGLNIENYLFKMENRNQIRKEFNLDAKFVVGHVGRFTKVKNHRFLIGVFSEIKKVREDSVLLLVGDGELKREICHLAKTMNLADSIIFVGTRSDVGNIMSAMDIFVFPSVFEGLGNVLVEAQVNGLPCLASEEILTDEVKITSGLQGISLQKTHKEWAESILSIDYDINKRLLNRRILQQSDYDIKDVVTKLMEIYENGLSEG